MLKQANIHQMSTTGFPHPSSQCQGTQRRLRDALFSCQSSDGIRIPFRSVKEVASKLIDNLIPISGKRLSSLFFSPGVPKRHFFEWPHLAENRWPSSGRKLTPTVLFQANVEVDTIGPDVDVLFAFQRTFAPSLIVILPRFEQARDRRGRETSCLRSQECS